MTERRPAQRKPNDIRPTTIDIGPSLYAEGSALIKMGNTHVLCTASVEEEVPKWLEGKGRGWVTGEYSMLPRATTTRTRRERQKVSGRTQEIQRLIGRALRACVDLNKLGERSIIVDCDVLQADGGTRTAAINGGCVALAMALKKAGVFDAAWKTPVSALSLGLKNGEVLTDLDYLEDSSCDVDMNFVVTGEEQFVEVQGTGEQDTFSQNDFQKLIGGALAGAKVIRKIQSDLLK